MDCHATFDSIMVNAPSHGFMNTEGICPHYAPFDYSDLGCGTTAGTYRWESKYDPRCVGPVRRYMWLDAWHVTSKSHEILAGKVAEMLLEYP